MPDVNVPQLPSGFQPVGNLVKPIQQQAGLSGMSLGDIVNMAATTQSYQKQKELMPYQIEAGKAESQRAQLEAQKAGVDLNQHYANIARGVLGGYLTDPDFINGNSKHMEQKIRDASEYLHKIGAEDKAGMTDKLIELAHSNPSQVYQIIKNGVQQAGGAAAQYQTQQQFQPTQLYQGGGQPAPGGAPQPTGAPGAPAGGQAPMQQQPQGAGMNLPFPVRNPNQPYAPFPQEAAAVTSGEQYYKGLSDFGINSVKYKRNVDEVIDAANKIEKEHTFTSGVAGAITRRVATALGDPQYVQLSKDLANVQIAALQASGGDLQTDAGKQLVAMANGDVTYPPEVLKNIANRAKADITNLDMQRQAADKFYRKYGANNMAAFKQAWADNADSKVFQAINIYNSMPQDKANEAVKKLFPDESQYGEFLQKYRNIKKLMNNGSL